MDPFYEKFINLDNQRLHVESERYCQKKDLKNVFISFPTKLESKVAVCVEPERSRKKTFLST